MPRDTSNIKLHEIGIFDPLCDDTIVFQYELPSSEKRILYRKKGLKFSGRKLKSKTPETQLEYAEKTIKGFIESERDAAGQLKGGFTDDGKPYASDPESPNYRKDWFAVVKKTSADLLMQAISVIYDGAGLESDDDDGDDDGDDGDKKNVETIPDET